MSKFLDKLLARKAEKITPYDEIRPYLQTFDIINCVPRGFIMGLIGHTAMVYRCKATGQVMVYESTQTGRKDNKSGVQLRPMREWVDNYKGKIYISRTEIIGDVKRTIAEIRCDEHIKQYRGTAYPNLKKLKGLWFTANAAVDFRMTKHTFYQFNIADLMDNHDSISVTVNYSAAKIIISGNFFQTTCLYKIVISKSKKLFRTEEIFSSL